MFRSFRAWDFVCFHRATPYASIFTPLWGLGIVGEVMEMWMFISRRHIKELEKITNYELRKKNNELRITEEEQRITNYGRRITNYELRITYEEQRITNYELRKKNYELRKFLRKK